MRSIEERRLEKKEAERWGYELEESNTEEQNLIKPSAKDSLGALFQITDNRLSSELFDSSAICLAI
jgi:hypothetical protein